MMMFCNGGCAILWRSDMNAHVQVIEVHSKGLCTICLTSDAYRLLLVCVYMPYKGSECMTDEFTDQFATVDSIMSANADCHVIIGGDFNVDYSRLQVHTATLKNFCDNVCLSPADLHRSANIDYSYHFELKSLVC